MPWFSEIFAYATSMSSFRMERAQMLAAHLLAKQHPYVLHNNATDDVLQLESATQRLGRSDGAKGDAKRKETQID